MNSNIDYPNTRSLQHEPPYECLNCRYSSQRAIDLEQVYNDLISRVNFLEEKNSLLEKELHDERSNNDFSNKVMSSKHSAEIKKLIEEKGKQICYLHDLKEELTDENKQLSLRCKYLEESLNEQKSKSEHKSKELESKAFDIEQSCSDKVKELELFIEKSKKKHAEEITKMVGSFESQIEEIMAKGKDTKDKLLKINYEKDEEIVRLISKGKSNEEQVHLT